MSKRKKQFQPFKVLSYENLQVQIDDHSGFCFGVVYAIEWLKKLDEKIISTV